MLRSVCALGLAATAAALLSACGSNSCPFRNIFRTTFESVVQGDFSVRDVSIPRQDRLEVDLSSAEVPGQSGRFDAWLTDADCDRLFDTPYPPASGAPSPRCRVYLGPVAPGSVSSRREVSPGTYRLFVQAYSSNESEVHYLVDVGVWGRSCRGAVPF